MIRRLSGQPAGAGAGSRNIAGTRVHTKRITYYVVVSNMCGVSQCGTLRMQLVRADNVVHRRVLVAGLAGTIIMMDALGSHFQMRFLVRAA